jgi:cobalt-zinc-cadmium efflux system outer membrane protein
VQQQLLSRSSHDIRPSGSPQDPLPFDLNPAEGLTESNVVEIALWNNGVFQENLSKLGFSRADLLQAGALSNPTLSMLFPWGPKQFEFTATFPLEALYLRPQRVRIAEIEAERVAEGLVQSGLDLIRDVSNCICRTSIGGGTSRVES